MQFIVIGRDGTDASALDRRLKARAEHLKQADEMRERGELLYAVAILDGADKMVGSVMITEFSDRAELDRWLAREPYLLGKVWETIEITAGRVAPAFARRT